MSQSSTPGVELADVAIVGFGPVGAALAGLLGTRGLKVVVMERDRDVFPLPRAAHIDHQGLRTLQEIGCLDAILPTMLKNPGLEFVTADGQILGRIPGDQPSVSGLPASMYFYQPGFDRTLRDFVAALPTVEVRLGVEYIGVDTLPDRVEIRTQDATGQPATIAAKWLVGCDGASSAVRSDMNIELLDLGFEEQWVVVDLLLNRPIPGLPDRSLNICDPSRPMTAIPIPGSRFRFEVMCLPGEDPVELQRPETVLPLLTRWIPTGAATIERSAVYTFHGLFANRWRYGRVLIAGDAAHQMPPFLGQGMCSGLRDAANLAWKLAAILSLNLTESLLDTYELERIPHVRAIIEAAIDAGQITCMLDPVQAAAMHRAFLSDSALPERRFAFSLPKLRRGPLVGEGGGDLFVQPAGSNGHQRLDDRIGQRFLVMGRNRDAIGEYGTWWAEAVGAMVTTVDQMPDSTILARWLNDRKADVVVVRPDHYVLFAGKDLAAITAVTRDTLYEQGNALSA